MIHSHPICFLRLWKSSFIVFRWFSWCFLYKTPKKKGWNFKQLNPPTSPRSAPRSGGLNSTSSSPQLRGEPVPCAPRPERYRRAAQLLQGAFEMTEVSPGRSWCLRICWCYMEKLEYPSREAGADIWYPKHTKTIQNVDKAEASKLNLVLECFWSVYKYHHAWNFPEHHPVCPKFNSGIPSCRLIPFLFSGMLIHRRQQMAEIPARNLGCIKFHGQQPESALPETNSSNPKNRPGPKMKGSSPNHPFPGANC